MQIRTAIQHSWATAVEMVGLFRKESLKSGLVDIKWLRFFELVSELFIKLKIKNHPVVISKNIRRVEISI